MMGGENEEFCNEETALAAVTFSGKQKTDRKKLGAFAQGHTGQRNAPAQNVSDEVRPIMAEFAKAAG